MKIPQDFVKTTRAAQHIAVLTGAGISAESGIPIFREAQAGLWAKYNLAELASIHAFNANPLLVQNWYKWRRSIVSQANPNETLLLNTLLSTLRDLQESNCQT